jgi:hypothetical protein
VSAIVSAERNHRAEPWGFGDAVPVLLEYGEVHHWFFSFRHFAS